MKYWIGALAFVLAGQADAACKANDAVGKWSMFQNNITAQDPHVGRCNIEVKKGGGYSGSCTLFPFNVSFDVKGNFAVQNDCNATLTQTFEGGNALYTVVLSKNKQIFAGNWTNGNGEVGNTNGVKQ